MDVFRALSFSTLHLLTVFLRLFVGGSSALAVDSAMPRCVCRMILVGVVGTRGLRIYNTVLYRLAMIARAGRYRGARGLRIYRLAIIARAASDVQPQPDTMSAQRHNCTDNCQS